MKKLPEVRLTTNEIRTITEYLYCGGYTDAEIYEALNGDANIGAIRRAIIGIEKERI